MPRLLNWATRTRVPLKSVRISACMMGHSLGMTSSFSYYNDQDYPLEVAFICPLDTKTTVVGFDAMIAGRTIGVQLREKKELDYIYDVMCSHEGLHVGQQSPVLLEEHLASGIFAVNVGTIPARETATVIMSTSSRVENNSSGALRFKLSDGFCPRQDSPNGGNEPDTEDDDGFSSVGTRSLPVNIAVTPTASNWSLTSLLQETTYTPLPYDFDFHLQVKMPCLLSGVSSPTHAIRVDADPFASSANEVFVTLAEPHTFDKSLEVLIHLEQPHKPIVVLEHGHSADAEETCDVNRTSGFATPIDSPLASSFEIIEDRICTDFVHNPVLMLNYCPDFSDILASNPKTSGDIQGEYIAVIDRSGSMSGAYIATARETLLLFLKSLPSGSAFNVVGFGSTYKPLFDDSVPVNQENVGTASTWVGKMRADLGGTNLFGPLEWIFSAPRPAGRPREVFILTDGAVSNTSRVIDLVRANSSHTRISATPAGSSTWSEQTPHTQGEYIRVKSSLARLVHLGQDLSNTSRVIDLVRANSSHTRTSATPAGSSTWSGQTPQTQGEYIRVKSSLTRLVHPGQDLSNTSRVIDLVRANSSHTRISATPAGSSTWSEQTPHTQGEYIRVKSSLARLVHLGQDLSNTSRVIDLVRANSSHTRTSATPAGSSTWSGQTPQTQGEYIRVKSSLTRLVHPGQDLSNTSRVIDLVRANSSHTRCWAVGIGEGASRDLIRGIAEAGRGRAEFVTEVDRMQAKLLLCLKRSLQPAICDVNIEWKIPDGVQLVQTPCHLPNIYPGDTLTVYGLLWDEFNVDQSPFSSLHGMNSRDSFSEKKPLEDDLLMDIVMGVTGNKDPEADVTKQDEEIIKRDNEDLKEKDIDESEHDQLLSPDNEKPRHGNEHISPDNEKLIPRNERISPDNENPRHGNERLSPDNEKLKAGNERISPDNEKLKAGNERRTSTSKDNLLNSLKEPHVRSISADASYVNTPSPLGTSGTFEHLEWDSYIDERILAAGLEKRTEAKREALRRHLERKRADRSVIIVYWSEITRAMAASAELLQSLQKRTEAKREALRRHLERKRADRHDSRDGQCVAIIRGTLCGKEFVREVPFDISEALDPEVTLPSGNEDSPWDDVIHQLAATTLIRDFEDEILRKGSSQLEDSPIHEAPMEDAGSLKEKIVELSQTANIPSRLTTFVAVDELTGAVLPPVVHNRPRDRGKKRAQSKRYGFSLGLGRRPRASFDSDGSDEVFQDYASLHSCPFHESAPSLNHLTVTSGHSDRHSFSSIDESLLRKRHSMEKVPGPSASLPAGSDLHKAERFILAKFGSFSKLLPSGTTPSKKPMYRPALGGELIPVSGKFARLVELQMADGAWQLDTSFSDVIDIPLETLHRACPMFGRHENPSGRFGSAEIARRDSDDNTTHCWNFGRRHKKNGANNEAKNLKKMMWQELNESWKTVTPALFNQSQAAAQMTQENNFGGNCADDEDKESATEESNDIESTKSRFWATLVALGWLEKKCVRLFDEWELMAGKAETWLATNENALPRGWDLLSLKAAAMELLVLLR
ncbi:VWA5B1 [Branchiostoma lanceolatum]|uniref:VWA5B1 protein n=1 Tax=Branchiostoma lanceolatum TaxID=7740 RepID=A0A8J9WGG4_BRALA|nr:VWA5B1 [Branchiostoma lanceolatum]